MALSYTALAVRDWLEIFKEVGLEIYRAEGTEVMQSEIRDTIARAIHESYRKSRTRGTTADDLSMVEWDNLPVYLKESNCQQADDIFGKLQRIGCSIHKVTDRHIKRIRFTRREIEMMAEMEHERWNAERLKDGWKLGKIKDVAKKISPYLLGWTELPEEVKEWDREAVRMIPELLAGIGLEVRRVKQVDQFKQ